MIKDLKLADPSSADIETPVCIIGSGVAGIFLAQKLQKFGLNVVVIEAGDEVARSAHAVSQRCIQNGILYRGADEGRSFGLGNVVRTYFATDL